MSWRSYHRLGFFILPWVAAICGCAKNNVSLRKEELESPQGLCQALSRFLHSDLESYQDRVDEAGRDYQHEQWLVETASPKASPEKLSQLFEKLQTVSYETEILVKAQEIGKGINQLSETLCPEKRSFLRAKQLLETSILTDPKVIRKEKENQDYQDKIVAQSNGFRLEIPGEKEPLSKALYGKKLRSFSDRKTRQDWYQKYNSTRAKKWMDWGFRDLIRSRNEEAKLAGFSNYYEYRFFRSQLDYPSYQKQLVQIKSELAPKLKQALRRLGKQWKSYPVEAWDVGYLREKASAGQINEWLKNIPEGTVLDLGRKFYSSLGVDIDSYHFEMDLYPRPGKNTHAFAMGVVSPHVDAKGKVLPVPKPDIRFLANLKTPVKWEDISTVIHELGHAVHFGEVRQPLGIFRGVGSVETEAIAMTLERMANSTEFLKAALSQVTTLSPDKLDQGLAEHVKAAQLEQAFVLVRQVFFSEFEHEIYLKPDEDYATIWARLYREYWGVEVPVAQADWDVDHFLMSPVYVQNYAIGIVMVEQIYESLLRDFKTSYQSQAIGERLKAKYFAPGLEWDYLALVEQLTGEPLSAKAALGLLKDR